MKNISLKQMRKDFEYLRNNLSDYMVNEDALVNSVFWELLDGKMDIKNFTLWCIKDLVSYCIDESEDNDLDICFLKNNNEAIEILKRYDIKI